MLDSIFIGMTGLTGYSKGLQVIANNTANMNTPGFKTSVLQYTDMFYSDSGMANHGGLDQQYGHGLSTLGTSLHFVQGQLQQTGNATDMAVDGDGLFILRDDKGDLHYTRAGQFSYTADGLLINTTDGQQVMGLGSTGELVPISLAGKKSTPGEATTKVTFSGNLSSTGTTQTISSINVIDALGGSHTLSLTFTNTSTTTPNSWSVALMEGTTTVGTSQLVFENGSPSAATSALQFTYTPAGGAAMPLELDFGQDVTSYSAGTVSTLAVGKVDGFTDGQLTKTAFDETGTMTITYSNGQTAKGGQVALARFGSVEDIRAIGNNQYVTVGTQPLQTGAGGGNEFGTVHGGEIETSNVDLSQEFSQLVVVQRGYQASSQIVSTANDMLQDLYAMKSK